MPIDELLDILRQVADAKVAWGSQLKLLQLTFPSELWRNLPEVDIRRDSDAAWMAHVGQFRPFAVVRFEEHSRLYI